MEPKESSFSFEKVFDTKPEFDSNLTKANPKDLTCFVKHGLEVQKLVESEMEKAKRINCSQLIRETSAADFKYSQEELFRKFLKLTDTLYEEYVDSINLFRTKNADLTRKKELLDYIKTHYTECVEFDFEYTNYEFPENIPSLQNAFEPVYQAFNNYYGTDSAGKIYNVIVEKNTKFTNLCRGEILGINDEVKSSDMLEAAKNTFKKDTITKTICLCPHHFEDIELDDDKELIEKIYKDFGTVKEEYKKLYKFINKTRKPNLMVNNISSTYGTERIFMNTILEICRYHLMAFQVKLDCATEYLNQEYAILCKAYEICQDNPAELSESARFAFERSLTDSPTDKYDELYADEYNNLEFEQLLTDCCIREALIISEGVNVEDRLQTLHEGVISSVINVLKKIKDFITNNSKKFVAWFYKYIASTKAYLEKYRDLITKNKLAGFEPLDIKNYPDGLKRIKTPIDLSKIQPEAESIAKAETDSTDNASKDNSNETDEVKICKLLLPDYTGKDKEGNDQTFADFCKDYFLGGPDESRMEADQFVPSEMYDACYNVTDMVNMLKSDQNKVSQFIDMLTNETNKAARQIDNKALDQTNENNKRSKSAVQGSDSSTPKDTPDAKETGITVSKQNGAAIMLPGTFFIEDSGIKVTKVSSATAKADNNPNVKSTVVGSDSRDFNAAKQKIQGLPNDQSITSKNLENRIKEYNIMARNISIMLQAKAIAAETICSDYMKLIKISVSYYINQASK